MKRIYTFFLITLMFIFQSVSLYSQIERIIGISDPKFSVMRDHFYKQFPKYSEQSYSDEKSGYLRREHTDKNYTHFKRWEDFWSTRLMPDGTFPPSNLISDAIFEKNALKAKNKFEQKLSSKPEWSIIGPIEIPKGGGNGRINCIQMHPNLPNLIWAGSAAGGAWKSTDYGQTWKTTCDDLFSMGVSDIAMPWNNPNIVYLATGDDDAGSTYTIGVVKSTDGGTTWNPTGLTWVTSQTQQIYRLLADPKAAGKLYAATSQGLQVTTDAGVTWSKKSNINFRDLEMRTDNPLIMIGCTGSEIHRSTDGGNTWTKITTTIPTTIGRISLAISPANQEYMYALCSDNSKGSGFGGLYRSVDGGKTWARRSNTPNILSHSVDGSGTGGQGWYDLTIACSYKQPNHVIIGGVNVWRSTDGGTTWEISAHWYGANGKPYVHADVHDLDYFPNSDKTIITGTDGGVFSSSNNGLSWTDNSDGLSITQYYHVATAQGLNPSYLGGAQDNGTTRFASNSWSQILGGDGMKCLINPTNSAIVYGAIQNGYLNRSTNSGKDFAGMLNPDATKESGRWVTPYVFNPKNPTVMYAGFRNIWKSTNGGAPGSWEKVSTFANTASTVKLIAVSPANPNIVLAMNDQVVYESTDAGETWNAKSLPGINIGAITSFEFSHDDEKIAWLTIGGFGNTRVFKTINSGATWTDISGNLPKIPTNIIVHEKGSPERLYVGTDIGVYYRDTTTNGWIDYSDGLPNTIVRDLQINYTAKTLMAGTYGRGLWKGNLVGCSGVSATATATGNLTFCAGDSVELKVNESYSSYRWSNGQTTKSIFVKQSGTYNATVTDNEGCTGTTNQIVVTVNPAPIARITPSKTLLCEGDSITLDAGVNQTYLWSTGDTTRRIVVKDGGKYTVTVSSSNGCVATSSVLDLVKNQAPEKPIISRQENTLQSSVIGQAYQWFEDGSAKLNAKQRTYTPGENSYGKKITVRVTLDNNCSRLSDDFLYSPLSADDDVKEGFKVYPNPVQNMLFFEFPSISHSALITIIDLEGKPVYSVKIDCHPGMISEKIRIADLPTGSYTIRIDQSMRTLTMKFVKQ